MVQRAFQMLPTLPLTDAGWPTVLSALEVERSCAYVLSPELVLLHVNVAWGTFAQSNGAPELAANWRLLGPIQSSIRLPELQEFYAARLHSVLSRNRSWSHTYECSSPHVFRKFQMLARSGPGQQGIVVVHSLVAASPVTQQASEGLLRDFTDSRGLIVRCAACGRTARPGQPHVWEWVPSLCAEAGVSTGICAICSVHEYGFYVEGA